MRTAMMWFDNSKDALTIKIQKAIDYYEKKYGVKPDLCLVHPKMFQDDVHIDKLTVRGYRPVLPGHLWLGVEDKEKGGENGK